MDKYIDVLIAIAFTCAVVLVICAVVMAVCGLVLMLGSMI